MEAAQSRFVWFVYAYIGDIDIRKGSMNKKDNSRSLFFTNCSYFVWPIKVFLAQWIEIINDNSEYLELNEQELLIVIVDWCGTRMNKHMCNRDLKWAAIPWFFNIIPKLN